MNGMGRRRRNVPERTGTERLNRAVRFYRVILRVGLTIMFLLFARSLLSQVPRPQLGDLSAYIVLKLSLIGYMYCWFFGCNRDLSVQNDILRDAPPFSIKEMAFVAVLVVAFGFLFYVEDPAVLAPVFLLFLTINILGWFYLKRVMHQFSRHAFRAYQETHDTLGEIKTIIYENYMFGRWQWLRFGTGLILLVILTAITFYPISTVTGLPDSVAFALLTLLTLCVLEAWIWYKRLELKLQWDGLDWLNERGFINSGRDRQG